MGPVGAWSRYCTYAGKALSAGPLCSPSRPETTLRHMITGCLTVFCVDAPASNHERCFSRNLLDVSCYLATASHVTDGVLSLPLKLSCAFQQARRLAKTEPDTKHFGNAHTDAVLASIAIEWSHHETHCSVRMFITASSCLARAGQGKALFGCCCGSNWRQAGEVKVRRSLWNACFVYIYIHDVDKMHVSEARAMCV